MDEEESSDNTFNVNVDYMTFEELLDLKHDLADQALAASLALEGYHEVRSSVLVPQEWLNANMHGEYRKCKRAWFFAEQSDAEWFILAWL